MIKKIYNNIMDKIKHKNQWRLYFYFNNQLIKKIYVPFDEQPFNNFYVITVYGKKHLFGTNMPVTIVVKPMLLKLTDTLKQHVHLEVKCFEGAGL